MTLEYSDPRSKMRVGRTYFFQGNYKKYVYLEEQKDEDDEWVVCYNRVLKDNPNFENEQYISFLSRNFLFVIRMLIFLYIAMIKITYKVIEESTKGGLNPKRFD
jgi:hypothetical protein